MYSSACHGPLASHSTPRPQPQEPISPSHPIHSGRGGGGGRHGALETTARRKCDPPTAVPSTTVGHTPTAAGYTPTAVGNRPTADSTHGRTRGSPAEGRSGILDGCPGEPQSCLPQQKRPALKNPLARSIRREIEHRPTKTTNHAKKKTEAGEVRQSLGNSRRRVCRMSGNQESLPEEEGADPRKGMANMEPCTFSAVENALGLATPGKGINPTGGHLRPVDRDRAEDPADRAVLMLLREATFRTPPSSRLELPMVMGTSICSPFRTTVRCTVLPIRDPLTCSTHSALECSATPSQLWMMSSIFSPALAAGVLGTTECTTTTESAAPSGSSNILISTPT